MRLDVAGQNERGRHGTAGRKTGEKRKEEKKKKKRRKQGTNPIILPKFAPG